MVQGIGGNRKKTRTIFRKKPSLRGKFSLTKYFQAFKVGEKVLLKAEPAIHGGMYFRRFNARMGIIAGRQGDCYLVSINDLGKKKTLIVHPVHLKRYQK